MNKEYPGYYKMKKTETFQPLLLDEKVKDMERSMEQIEITMGKLMRSVDDLRKVVVSIT